MRLEVSKKHLGNFISGLCHSEKSFLPSWWREASGCGRTSRHYSWPPEARNWVGRYKGQADGGITTREQERHRTHSVGNQAAGVKHRWPFSCAFSVGQVISRGALLWACVPFQSTKKYLCEADRFLNAFFCRQHRQKAVRGRFHRPRSRWSSEHITALAYKSLPTATLMQEWGDAVQYNPEIIQLKVLYASLHSVSLSWVPRSALCLEKWDFFKKKTTGQFLEQLIELYCVALRMGDQEIKVVMH